MGKPIEEQPKSHHERHFTGEEAHHKKWIAYPHYLVLVFDVIILVAALRVWHQVKIDMPETQETAKRKCSFPPASTRRAITLTSCACDSPSEK